MAVKKVLVSLDLLKNEIQNAVIQNLGSAPASPKAGQVYFDTADKILKIYDGTKWSAVGELAIASTDTLGGVKVAATNAQVLVDGTTGVMSLANATHDLAGAVKIADANDIAGGTGAQTGNVVTAAQLKEVKDSVAAGVIYKGTWDLNPSGTAVTDYSAITVPAKKGDLYYVKNTTSAGTSVTIGGIEWSQGDYLLVNKDVASGSVSSSDVEKIDNTESSDIVRLNATQTLTNKTIDADNNTISNLETDNFKAGVIQTTVHPASAETEGDPVALDTSLPTEKAVRTAIDNAVSTLDSDKQDKVTGAVENNIATWNASGNTKDSGKAFTTSVAAAATASDDKIATEKAVRTAIDNAMSGSKLTADNGALTPAAGVCTWTISNTLATADVQVKVYEKSVVSDVAHYEEVYCGVDVTASTITISINSSVDIAAAKYHAVIEA